MTITLDELLELRKAAQIIDDAKERAKNGNLLDLVMPNGKLLRNCNRADLQETSEWFVKMGDRLDDLKRKAGP